MQLQRIRLTVKGDKIVPTAVKESGEKEAKAKPAKKKKAAAKPGGKEDPVG